MSRRNLLKHLFIRDQCQPAQVAYWWLTCADHWCTINANDCWCCLSDSWHWVVSEGDYEGREVAAILTTMALIEWCHPEGTVVWLIKQILFNADWKWVFGQKRLGVAPSHSSLVVFQFPFCGFECSLVPIVSCGGWSQRLHHCARRFTKSQLIFSWIHCVSAAACSQFRLYLLWLWDIGC